MEPISERVEAYFEQGPVCVEEITPPALVELESGVAVEERFFGRPGESANFRVTASMEVVNADQAEPAYQAIRRISDCLRLLWPIADGFRVDGPHVSNHEEIYKCLLARAPESPVRC